MEIVNKLKKETERFGNLESGTMFFLGDRPCVKMVRFFGDNETYRNAVDLINGVPYEVSDQKVVVLPNKAQLIIE